MSQRPSKKRVGVPQREPIYDPYLKDLMKHREQHLALKNAHHRSQELSKHLSEKIEKDMAQGQELKKQLEEEGDIEAAQMVGHAIDHMVHDASLVQNELKYH